MTQHVELLQLAGFALGALGAALLFMEFFMQPSYVKFDPDRNAYRLDTYPDELTEHTWFGRVGALFLSIAFLAGFFAILLG